MLQSHSVDVRAARPIIGASLLTTLFRSMTRIRATEETIAELLDKNEIHCPTHLCTGQEAIAAGVCAGLQRLPVIFICENNLYSSHMHIRERRVKDNIFRAGDAHGIPGVRVDGNDASVVYETALDAVRRARSGGGPTLIECRTYRWRGHVGASMDFDAGGKRKDELRDLLSEDAVGTVPAGLLQQGLPER